MSRKKIILAGHIGINKQDDNIVWDVNVGSISLDNLSWYLGSMTSLDSLPETIEITSHLTGKVKIFKHEASPARDREELYVCFANNAEPNLYLWVQCRAVQIDHLRRRAERLMLEDKHNYNFQ